MPGDVIATISAAKMSNLTTADRLVRHCACVNVGIDATAIS